MILNIRGTHGAGKSTAIRKLFEEFEPSPIYGVLGERLPEAYGFHIAGQPVYALGPYTTACGGCDRVLPYALIPPLIEKYATQGHVVFEGSLISTCWGVVGEVLERGKHDGLVLFLDTPVEECVRRVRARRLERGNGRPFDPKGLIAKHATIARLQQKIETAGLVRTLSVSSESAAAIIDRTLGNRAG